MASTANINSYTKDTGFGSGSDRTKFDEKGQLKLEGDAVQWDDLVGDIMSKKLYSTTGRIDYDWDNNSIRFQSGGDITDKADRIQFNYQKMHAIKENSEMRFHIHYEQDSTNEYVFTLKYRVQGNGEAKTTAWTTVTATCNATNHVFPYTSGTINQILQFPAIDWSNVGISSTVQLMLARTDSITGDCYVTFCDAHVTLDAHGSNQEYVK